MKKLLVFPLILLLVSCAGMRDLTRTGSDTGLGSDPFEEGGSFLDTDANAINNAINDNDARLDDIEEIVGPVISDGDGTYSSPTDGVDDTHIDWGTGAGQVSAADVPLSTTNFDGLLSTEDDVQSAIETLEDAAAADLDDIQSMIQDALQAGWTVDLDDLVEDTPVLVTHLSLVSGEAFTDNSVLYLKTDETNGARLYKANADSSDADRLVYRPFCQATEAASGAGETISVRLLSGPAWIERDDTYSVTYNQDEGKSLVLSDDGNGWEVYYSSAPSSEGDVVMFISIVIQAYDLTAETHDIFLRIPSVDINVIPAES